MGVGAGLSLYQIIKGAGEKKAATKQKNALMANMPKYQGSQELDSLYQQEKAAAATPAQDTAQFKMGEQQSQRNLATGLGAAGAAGTLGQGMVSKLVQGTNDASMRNLVAAQNLKEQRMGRLGGLVGQKAAEGMRKFQINQQQPWELQFSDAMAKGTAGSQAQQMGFQNFSSQLGQFGAIQGSKDYLKQYAKYKGLGGSTGKNNNMNSSETDPTGHFLI